MPSPSNDGPLPSNVDKFQLDTSSIKANILWYFTIYLGMFFPILILLFFNYNVVVGMTATD